MAGTPQKPEEIFDEFTGECQKRFGAELLSIILFGSGAGRDYIPGKSDINFLITLTDRGIDNLAHALEMVARWRKRNVAIPLFMTCAHLIGSQDAYPIELLNMKRHYVVVSGRDVLADLTFDRAHIRIQLEREIRGKLLHLRSGYLATEGNARKIRSLITLSLTAFLSLFCALLYLKQIDIPESNREIIVAAGDAVGIDRALFLQCDEIRRKTDRFSASEVKAIFQAYLREISRLSDEIDRMEMGSTERRPT